MDCASVDDLCNELHAHVASYHFSVDVDLNESNPGLGYRRFFTDRAYLMVGGYQNSIDRFSAYVGAGYEVLSTKYVGGRISIGAVTGYYGGTTGYVSPELIFRPTPNWGVILNYIPEYESAGAVETVGLSLVYRW